MNYYRIYLRGLHVGIGVRAERMDIDETSLFFWGPGSMVASFWLPDVESIRDIAGKPVAIEATVPPTTEDVIEALTASLA